MRHVGLPLSPQSCGEERCAVPPSPDLLIGLRVRYDELIAARRLPADLTFAEFYMVWRSRRRGPATMGLDDGATRVSPELIDRIDRPAQRLAGEIRTLVLLVDFPDQPAGGDRTTAHFERMLFGDGTFPSGSMRDYYRLISRGTVDVTGEVHGWLRLPRPLSFYAAGNSGMGTFPRNAQGMARDAVIAAVAAGVDFSGFDVFGEGQVTALFLVHAGRGAEVTGRPEDLWSLKWGVPGGVDAGGDARVGTFLTVPEDCNMGVCAHEWGHLAARWADYYDIGRQAHLKSAGLGDYCLMASGSWGDHGLTPTLPTALLPLFHGWTRPRVVTTTTEGLALRPAHRTGDALMVRNPAVMKETQYVLVEYRQRAGQDAFLPDQGVAVYVVDEEVDNVSDESRLAIELLQADGRSDLAKVFFASNRGDASDLYPFRGNRRIDAASTPPLDLPDGTETGLAITVRGTPGAATMTIDVEVDDS